MSPEELMNNGVGLFSLGGAQQSLKDYLSKSQDEYGQIQNLGNLQWGNVLGAIGQTPLGDVTLPSSLPVFTGGISGGGVSVR
jgi:hypothetical protein